MKRLSPIFASTITFVAICLLLTVHAESQETGILQVLDEAICLDVVNRECVDGNTLFPANVGKLYCLTRIEGAHTPTEVTHVWYFGDRERARITLTVRSPNWRTYSSKIIQPRETGSWQVNVLDVNGKLLKVIEFEITP